MVFSNNIANLTTTLVAFVEIAAIWKGKSDHDLSTISATAKLAIFLLTPDGMKETMPTGGVER